MPRYPHLLLPGTAPATRFTSTLSPRSQFTTPTRQRVPHGNALIGQLQAASATQPTRVQLADGSGFYQTPALLLTFESAPDFALKFESLDLQASKIELLNVKEEDRKTLATVRVPHDKVKLFLTRLEKYRDADPNAPIPEGKKRKPNDYHDFAESISAIKLATLKELWSDSEDQYPGPNTSITWEVWLRMSDDPELSSEQLLREAAATLGYEVTSNALQFVDRTVVLVRGTREQLSLGADVLGIIAELRKAKVAADFFVGLRTPGQHDWIQNLLGRLTGADEAAPVVSLLDTGLNHGHPLLRPLIVPDRDLHTYKPQWGVHDGGPHGTWMAGIAMFGDLAPALAGNGPVTLEHGLESHKMINLPADPHNPELFGAVTVESVNRLEAGVQRSRIYCMAVTADDSGQGRPSSWSAAVDTLASGADDDERRLILISAGNMDPAHHNTYPASNEVSPIQDPAQAWNAITVGGYTEKVFIDQVVSPGWTPVAASGDLAPSSTTSVTWTKPSRPPFKPDIVMEAGNLGRSHPGAHPLELPELMMLTTSDEFEAGAPPFITMGETSGATALAANLTARLAARYPAFTPETLRGLLIHSARWTPAMLDRARTPDGFIDTARLLRTFGYGTPNEAELFSSANNSLTLIAQDSLQPFLKENGAVKSNDIKHHAIPWPADVLRALPLGTEVEMRITLSYFVEPSPGERGWDRKYGYASHGLRYSVRRATETAEQFRQRINAYEQEEEYEADHHGETGQWTLGGRQPSRGSIHSNLWRGTAQDLANRSEIAIYPTLGWWRTRPKEERFERTAHYSLIVSITTPDQATDIYTPVATQIGVPVEVLI